MENAEGATGGKPVSSANANVDNVTAPTAVDAYNKLLASVNDISCKITTYDQKLFESTQKLENTVPNVGGSVVMNLASHTAQAPASEPAFALATAPKSSDNSEGTRPKKSNKPSKNRYQSEPSGALSSKLSRVSTTSHEHTQAVTSHNSGSNQAKNSRKS